MRQKGMTWLLIGLVTVCGWFCVERTVQAEQEGETKQEETGAVEDDEEAPEFGEVRLSADGPSAEPVQVLARVTDGGTVAEVWMENVEEPEERCRLEETGEEAVYSCEVDADSWKKAAYRLMAEDAAGNRAEYPALLNIELDKLPPDSEPIWVQYQVDGGKPEKPERFLDRLAAGLKKLFAGDQIEAMLYLRDEGSGIREATVRFGGAEYRVEPETGRYAVIEGETYEVLPLLLTKEAAESLKIEQILDRAGNAAEGIEAVQPVEGSRILILDRTAPTVAIKLPGEQAREAGIYYYAGAAGEKEQVTLTFREAQYAWQADEQGKPVRPEITVRKNGESLEDVEIAWGAFQQGQLEATLSLPYEEDQETEYRIEATYQDGSGHVLEAAENGSGGHVTAEGRFVSDTLVLDARPPRLTRFVVEGETDYQVERQGEKLPVYRNRKGADTTLIFTVEDAEKYWRREQLVIRVLEAETEREVERLQGDNPKLRWEDAGDLHTGQLEFDGEPGQEGCYRVELACPDQAGNPLNGTGTYESGGFILDHCAPVAEIRYTKAVRMVTAEGTDLPENAGPRREYTSYYRTEIQVEVEIKEQNAVPLEQEGELTGLLDFHFLVNGTEEKPGWEKDSEDQYTARFTLTREGDYRLRLAYEDAAGNLVECEGQTEDGICESPLLVLDRTPPLLSVDTDREPDAVYQERRYFTENTVLRLTVQDENFRLGELKESLRRMTAVDSEGKAVEETTLAAAIEGLNGNRILRGSGKVELPLSTEANYRISVIFTDLAGNPAVWQEESESNSDGCLEMTVDKTDPEAPTLTESGGLRGGYGPFGWIFAKQTLVLTGSSRDQTAGIRKLRFRILDEEGKETLREQELEPAVTGTFRILLPMEQTNFKGRVELEVFDSSGRNAKVQKHYGIESGEKHQEAGTAALTILTEPGRVVGGHPWYNGDVEIRADFQDSYTGLGSYVITADGERKKARNYREEADGQSGPVREASETLRLEATQYNRNDIQVTASYTDNAGHTGEARRTLSIDMTKPEIRVTYDRNQPERDGLYREPRTATVTVKERNFDPGDVEFFITNTEGSLPEISGWSHSGSGEESLHSCKVAFQEDGTYTFRVAVMDLAGNQAVSEGTDTFTIDRTRPELQVSWEGPEARNGSYYPAERRARIQVRELNFDPGRVRIEAAATEGETPIPSVWQSNGELHTAFVSFGKDGRYALAVSGADLAGNEMEPYEEAEFVIDGTPPELELFGVGDQSANRGEVRPGVRYSDAHPDRESERITLKGCHNGTVELTGQTLWTQQGLEWQMDNIPEEQELDDLYRLEAEVADLAGNLSRASITFSVNRFGSVYTMDADTEKLAGKNGLYFTDREPELVVTETNVDTLSFRSITCKQNGITRILTENQDFQVTEQTRPDGWKQYTYRIGRKNFQKEGIYAVTIYSEDRAENASDNNSRGKSLNFAVDKTAPSIVLSGVEEQGSYREKRRQILLDVQDNLGLREVQVHLGDQTLSYSGQELLETDGRASFYAESAGDWQELTVEAVDQAGNRAGTEPIRFLVTPSIWMQIFRNRRLMMTAVSLSLAGLLAAGLLLRKFFRDRKQILTFKEEETMLQ